jgi:DNA-binding beta-propeller fold protein YncE
MLLKLSLWLVCVPLAAQDMGEAQLRALVAKSPRLSLQQTELRIQKPNDGWALEMVSSVTTDAKGVIYLLQRGSKADPVVALDSKGRVLRSWGKGLYQIPHSIRIDPEGNVWTTDAKSSMVYKFTPEGKKLLEIAVGGQPPDAKSEFCGTTDIAFAPGGRIFISDGYANARILEYTAQGQRVRQWGTPGTGPGQFHLPHGIAIDNGTIYVADRENGRIQRFNLQGKYLGEWSNLGKTFSLRLRDGALWIGTQPRNLPNGAPGWLMKIDRETGAVLGYVESTGHHSVEATGSGELLTGTRPDQVLWFRAPGSNL